MVNITHDVGREAKEEDCVDLLDHQIDIMLSWYGLYGVYSLKSRCWFRWFRVKVLPMFGGFRYIGRGRT